MNNRTFKLSLLVISLLAARGALASTTFDGDTNQSSSSDPIVSISNDMIVGNTLPGNAETPSGSLVVNDGSIVNVARTGSIGLQQQSFGQVDIIGAGTELNISRALYVGNQGAGVLNITDGAKVTSNSWGTNSAYIGNQAGAKGTVTVTGNGSSWTTNGSMDVGTRGEGTLIIKDHGEVNVGAAFWVGRGENSQGRLLVTDNGVLNASTMFLLGIDGNGTAEVSNGGQINTRLAAIGELNGQAQMLITGQGSQLNTGEFVRVGQREGTASLVVADGARVTTSLDGYTPGNANAMDIGFRTGDTGSVLVTGQDSVINTFGQTGLTDPNSTHSTAVGLAGSGELTLQDGGTLDTYNVWLAKETGSTGIINIGAARGATAAAAGKLLTDENGAIYAGLGEAEINFNHTDSNYIFDSAIIGQGAALNVNVDAGTTILTGENNYQGTTTITGGELRAGAENTFSASSDFAVNQGGQLSLNDFNQSVNHLTNAGNISLGNTLSGTVLTVNGNYTGDNGLIVFNSVLNGDDSSTDRLVVTGDSSGTTRVAVNNLGGSGSKTIDGIELITIGGDSAGDFIQNSRIVAGAYDYQLVRGEGNNASNWYLTNQEIETGPGPAPQPNPEAILRPEAAAYTANLAAAASLFETTLSDRLGETEYTDTLTGEQKLTSLWIKNTGAHSRNKDNSGQLSTQANRYSIMLGGDLATGGSARGDSWRLGALAGYGNSHSKTRSALSQANAKGDINGYTTGLYGTWFADGSSERGLYIDNVLQYSWFDNKVQGDNLQQEKYRSKGLSMSVESGYVFPMGGAENNQWFIQPKASLSWSGIKADDHREANGTRVESQGNNNLTSSLGVKTFIKGYSAQDANKNRFFKPFAEANWIHNSESYGANMDGVNVSQAGTRNLGEVKLGVEGRLTPQLNLTGFASHRFGEHDYQDTRAVIGVKYTFR